MSDSIRPDLEKALDVLIRRSIAEIKAQGHTATGRGIASFETQILPTMKGFIGNILVEDYMLFVDSGTRPHRPPFKAIFDWAKVVKGGISDEEAKRFAWAVISTMEKVGIPSPGSYAYSSNGRRKEWSKFAIAAAESDIGKILLDSDWLERRIDNIIRESQK